MSVAIDPFFWQVARWLLAGLFAAGLWHKLRAYPAFVMVVHDYRLLPTAIVPFAAASIVLLEGVACAGLVSGLASRPAAGVALSLLGIYSCAIAINLARGRRDIDCGCLGPVGSAAGGHRLSGWLLVRNTLLIGVAAVMLAPVSQRDLLWLDMIGVVPGVLVAALIYFAADQLIANRPVLDSLLR